MTLPFSPKRVSPFFIPPWPYDLVVSPTYCQAVIRELEEMRLNPELDLLRIETLKKNIPSIDIYQETIGERTLRGEEVNPKLMRK